MTRVLREPLVHFFVIGTALFLVQFLGSRSDMTTAGQNGSSTTSIVVNRDEIERMSSQFEKTWQRVPTEDEQKALVEDFVRNEVFYREALAAGLDKDDEILKRRLRQRMEFVYEDLSSLKEPSDEDLIRFMQSKQADFMAESQCSFRQVYVRVDGQDADAEERARGVLAQLSAGADPDSVGDPTLLEHELPLTAMSTIARQFGEEFAKGLLTLEPGVWQGPIPSTYGWHVILLKERREARPLTLEEGRDRARQEWLAARQKELKDAAYVKLRERYTISIEATKQTPAPVTTGKVAEAVPR